MTARTYFRDLLRIGPGLRQVLDTEVAGGRLSPGDTVYLAGREVTHDQNYVLQVQDYHLVIAAETYDCNGGGVDVSSTKVGDTGASGSPGKNGEVEIIKAVPRVVADSTPGTPGASGAPGEAAASVTLVCGELKAARVTARGGVGGAGAPGGRGGQGDLKSLHGHEPDTPEPRSTSTLHRPPVATVDLVGSAAPVAGSLWSVPAIR